MKMKSYCLTLLAATVFLSCQPKQIQLPSALELAKTELTALLKKEGMAYGLKTEVYEDSISLVTILKAKNENDTLQASAQKLREGLLLGAIRMKNKKDNQITTYTSTLVLRESKAFLNLVNVATKATQTIDLSPADDILPPPPPPLPPSCDLNCCLDNFESYLCVYQNLANKHCQTYYPAVICCDESQNLCISVHYIIRPTRWKCLITDILQHAGLSTLPRLVMSQPKPN